MNIGTRKNKGVPPIAEGSEVVETLVMVDGREIQITQEMREKWRDDYRLICQSAAYRKEEA